MLLKWEYPHLVEIINTFLHCLLHYHTFSLTYETYLHASLVETCKLSQLALEKMYFAQCVYGAVWERGEGWNRVGGMIWAGVAEKEEKQALEQGKKEIEMKEVEGEQVPQEEEKVEAIVVEIDGEEPVREVQKVGEEEKVAWLNGQLRE